MQRRIAFADLDTLLDFVIGCVEEMWLKDMSKPARVRLLRKLATSTWLVHWCKHSKCSSFKSGKNVAIVFHDNIYINSFILRRIGVQMNIRPAAIRTAIFYTTNTRKERKYTYSIQIRQINVTAMMLHPNPIRFHLCLSTLKRGSPKMSLWQFNNQFEFKHTRTHPFMS